MEPEFGREFLLGKDSQLNWTNIKRMTFDGNMEKRLISNMYTGVYKLKSHMSVTRVVEEKPIINDGFLIGCVLRLVKEYKSVPVLDETGGVNRTDQGDQFLQCVSEDLVRYTTQSVESILEDSLNKDIIRLGLANCYENSRNRCYRSLLSRKEWWKSTSKSGLSSKRRRVCIAYQTKSCKYSPCKFDHVCKTCGKDHPQSECPDNKEKK